MNKLFCSFALSCLTAFLLFFNLPSIQAQTTGGTMTVEQATAIKAIKVANLEKDTYFKSGGFIVERYEERPAYVFNYSDGITRKVYLYTVYSATDTKQLGLLALYQNGKTGDIKSFVIPGASADKAVWANYLDDLKYVGEKEPGLMSALTFVLTREMASLMDGGTKTDENGTKKKEEYNFCFAADAAVTMANGSVKAIREVTAGEQVMGYNPTTRQAGPTLVKAVAIHPITTPDGQCALSRIWLTACQEITASRLSGFTLPVALQATPNHPVMTQSGRKPLGEVTVGEVLYHHNPSTGTVEPYRVVRTEQAKRPISTVYNLVTETGGYVVDDIIVLDK